MPTNTDICNLALQEIGTRTDVTDAELAAGSTNEAKQFNLVYAKRRDDLLRLAPWDCAFKTANLTYITSQPGTPENTNAATTLWQPGQPQPPWAYEYQYPVDCLRAIQIIPANQTGFSGSIPITTAVTGGASAYWWGSPVKFKVQTDSFFPVTAATVTAGGSGYVVGDFITVNAAASINPGAPPMPGAPVILQVKTAPGGVLATVDVISQVPGTPVKGGSYFGIQPTGITQASSTGNGTGAVFTLTQSAASPQRVILTNQEYATLQYIAQVVDPNVMDSLFQTAWIKLTAASMVMSLKGDKATANMLIQEVNDAIQKARAVDGNEGYTVNDVTPDWIRIRGVAYSDGYASGPYSGYDFGGVWPMYL